MVFFIYIYKNNAKGNDCFALLVVYWLIILVLTNDSSNSAKHSCSGKAFHQ